MRNNVKNKLQYSYCNVIAIKCLIKTEIYSWALCKSECHSRAMKLLHCRTRIFRYDGKTVFGKIYWYLKSRIIFVAPVSLFLLVFFVLRKICRRDIFNFSLHLNLVPHLFLFRIHFMLKR